MQSLGCRILCVACFVAGFCVLSAAQTVSLTVDVPFQFNVGEKVLPAGHYVILALEGTALKILGQNEMTITAKANQISGQPPDGAGVVSFNCYGNRCFLSRFWNPRANIGKELLKSRLEKDVAGHGDQLAIIVLKATPYEQRQEQTTHSKQAVRATSQNPSLSESDRATVMARKNSSRHGANALRRDGPQDSQVTQFGPKSYFRR